MIMVGNLVYGIVTTYDEWVFARRVHGQQGEDILEVTNIYKRYRARLALAAFMKLVYDDSIARGSSSSSEGSNTANKPIPPTLHLGSGIRYPLPTLSNSNGYFSPGTNIAGYQFTTTKDFLGIDSLTLTSNDKSTILCMEEYTRTTLQYHDEDSDLVWRLIDTTIPQYFEDSHVEDAITMEITTYMHLRQEWGSLVPHFLYFGYDIRPIWVLVTSCERMTLSELAKRDGGLTEEMKESARQSLRKLHSLGVIHGKAHSDHVVYRESDGQTIWMDFTLAILRLEDVIDNDEFEAKCFDNHLSTIPTIQK